MALYIMRLMKSGFTKEVDNIVTNIRLTRQRLNYTQDYMAMKLNCSQNAYSKLELGYSKLTVMRLIEVCNVFDISLIDIINPNEQPTARRFIYTAALQAK
jgi:transcriptional regulator with XRE-family HTH domain